MLLYFQCLTALRWCNTCLLDVPRIKMKTYGYDYKHKMWFLHLLSDHTKRCLVFSRPKEPGASSEDSSHIRFFSFSLIEGYISLVMDEQTTQRLSKGKHLRWIHLYCCLLTILVLSRRFLFLVNTRLGHNVYAARTNLWLLCEGAISLLLSSNRAVGYI